MKRFASHRLYILKENILLKNYVVEVENRTGAVCDFYPFTEEISFTEWLGGLIVISQELPQLSVLTKLDGIPLVKDDEYKKSVPSEVDNTLLYAYYVSDFSISCMTPDAESRVVQLV